MKNYIKCIFIILCLLGGLIAFSFNSHTEETSISQIKMSSKDKALFRRGQYLANIGVCNACHTRPKTGDALLGSTKADSALADLKARTDEDWYSGLDNSHFMAGGVPFYIRIDSNTHGIVYSKNITPDVETGIGKWSTKEIYTVLKTGKRRDGTSLFLFPPHSFFKNLAENDVNALIFYLKQLKPIKNKILPRSLPFPVSSDSLIVVKNAPSETSIKRGEYLTSALVGCKECHSHTDEKGVFQAFSGGRPGDPVLGVFKLGPDIPIRQTEKGFSAFPYPGYSLLYSGNLTRFGKGGDLSSVSEKQLVNAIRSGVKLGKDNFGRPELMGHVMMWQFYRFMNDKDAYSIIKYVKSLKYIKNDAIPGIYNYGTNWELTFEKMYGAKPSTKDKEFFGK